MNFTARESNRVDSENFVSYNMFYTQGQIVQAGIATTIDISRTGTALHATQELTVGAKLQLTLGVGDEIVKLTGVIRNQTPIGDGDFTIGVEFDFISNEALDKLSLIYPDILK